MSTTPERIAMVAHALEVGGMESMFFGLARGLRALGADVTLVVTERRGAWHSRPRQEDFARTDLVPPPWWSRRRHALEVARCLRPYDAVLLHHSRSAQSGLGLLGERSVAVSVLHNDDEAIFRVGLGNADNLDWAVAVSPVVQERALEQGAAAERLLCIANGVEVPASYPKAAARRGTAPLRLVFLGRLEQRQKGILDLPDILARVLAAGLEVRFDVIGAGGADAALLRQRLAALLPPERLCFHGNVPHPAAMELLQQADLCLLPSRFEGAPMVVLEAMARGVVPVASRLPGSTESLCRDGEEGFLPAAGDTEAFAAAILRLGRDPALWARLSHAAWERTRRDFGSERMARRYLDLVQGGRGTARARSGKLYLPLLGRASFVPEGLRRGLVALADRRRG